jgi:Mn2+/Fe2+ NRAMP family transporter
MKALVWAGIVQGFSTPFLMLLVLRITSNKKIMGRWTNTRALNVLGWATFVAIACATIGLVVAWLR